MYRVIRAFADINDGNRPYAAGDIYPRDGLEASAARIAELSGNSNRRGIPLIVEAEEKKSTRKRVKKNERDD